MAVEFVRTHTCGELRAKDIGKKVRLSGWVHRVRDLGGVVFVELRDKFGRTQISCDTQSDEKMYAMLADLKTETVITIEGIVARREQANKALETGEIEIQPDSCTILSKAQVVPFAIADESQEAHEELRLKYRYLDMRRGLILNNLTLRHKTALAVRRYMDSMGFTEVTTPLLGKSTPEGSRDYLVPSRVHTGQFYALPQSPQIFKQLLMVGGLDRYFQIAICCRDEDLRAERQPEFTQIDIEMSYATQKELFPIVEGLVQEVFSSCIGVEVQGPFRHMTYAECIDLYGTDKPDLRFDMRFYNLNEWANTVAFPVFQEVLKQNGIIKGFCVPGASELSRKQIEEYTEFVKQLGSPGLVWIKHQGDVISSSINKFVDSEQLKTVANILGMKPGDFVCIVAGQKKRVHQTLDHLRRKLAKDRNLIHKNRYEFLWVTDFPLFQYNDEEGRIESEHHPFTSPHFEDLHLLDVEPLKMRSASYDLVVNGYELASGSQRIHDPELQDKIFKVLGLSEEERSQRFGFFIEALRFGTPPHLGAALGFDRVIMILAQTENIRDVIAFPKTLKASDLMMEAPASVERKQLQELKITLQV